MFELELVDDARDSNPEQEPRSVLNSAHWEDTDHT
jgi:hypothetical protein